MRIRLLTAACLALSVSACTTVDMSDLGNSSGMGVAVDNAPNVVEKATSRLFALFSSKGWSTHDSRKRMQSAASLLLNGLDDKTLSDDPSPYVTEVASSEVLASDVREADYHIDQIIKAADVFLAMSGPDEELRMELGELEQALLASRQAEKVFTEASERVGSVREMERLSKSVDRLRDITDEFGRRVRRAQSETVAAVSGSLTL